MNQPANQQTREEIMDVLIQAISDHPGTYKMLATRTGLSSSCIANIARDQTIWPRWSTFEILIEILKLKMTLSKRN